MKLKTIKHYRKMMCSSFLIGCAFNIILFVSHVFASQFSPACGGYLAVTDFLNPSGVENCVMKGYSVQNIYGENNKLRIQYGIYSPDIDPGEENLSFFGLYDNKGNLRLLFRLDGLGGDESPMLLMKDTRGQNRVLMGLGLQGGQQDPFLALIDRNQYKKDFIGNFVMPR